MADWNSTARAPVTIKYILQLWGEIQQAAVGAAWLVVSLIKPHVKWHSNTAAWPGCKR